jgi:two-component system nitrogen regulation response regulator GlnG
MVKLLVVDDERSVRHAFSRVFEESDVALLTASTGAEGVEMVTRHEPDSVVLDIMLPDRSGLEVLKDIQAVDSTIPVIFITGSSTSESAIEATRLGAFDYLVKPLDFGEIEELVRRAFEIRRLAREPVALAPGPEEIPTSGDVLVGSCAAMQAVYKAIGRVAPQTVTVLIHGESGTGKELVARAIYQHSNRSDGPFLAVNCAAIPEALLESELFGHEKGSFTSADRRRIGKFEQCSGGTLFLDEIGDMPRALQGKILRVLQDQAFERVGGNETIRTDVRIIAATNRDLENMVARETFRGDLFYRLNIYTIMLPPLRARQDDLPLLINHFLARANRELGRQVRTVAPETIEALRGYAWPGNVRELQSVLKRAVLQAAGSVLVPGFLPDLATAEHASAQESHAASYASSSQWEHFIDERIAAGSQAVYDEAVALTERQIITGVLRRTGGNQVQASKILGITRTTLRSKLRTLGITLGRVVHDEDEGSASSEKPAE